MTAKILIVGGFVRDRFLKKPSHDIDFIVVGMTKEEFLRLHPDAQEVGKDFPVFKLHGEDYAFARRERSTGPGYNDFECEFHPEVTLEDDLNRRDLTINAIAMCPETGQIVCPPTAMDDLELKVLRHVSDAFREDPLRVFRLARFYSGLDDFTIHPTTVELVRGMKDLLPALDSERVWTEVEKALHHYKPSKFFEALRQLDALDYWFPELKELMGVVAGPPEWHPEEDTWVHSMDALDLVARMTDDPMARWSALVHDLGKGTTDKDLLPRHKGHDERGLVEIEKLCDRLGVPKKFRRSALLFCEEHMRFHLFKELNPGKAVTLLLKMGKTPMGILGTLCCAVADSMNLQESKFLKRAHDHLLTIRLPEHHQGRGLISGEILLSLRAHEWKHLRNQRWKDEETSIQE